MTRTVEAGCGIPPSKKAGWFIEQIGQEIGLLNQLYLLSQTESLILENRHMDALGEIVSQREALVAELYELSERVTAEVRAAGGFPAQATFHERQSLAFLKTEGMELLHRIHQTDSKNRLRLEEFRAGAVKSSHELQQELRLHRAYDLPQTAIASQLSEVS